MESRFERGNGISPRGRDSGKVIPRIIGFVLDRVPYGMGRLTIFVFSFGSLRSERWAKLGWLSELFAGPLWLRSHGHVIVTRRGVRWTGYFIIALILCGFATLVLRTILRM